MHKLTTKSYRGEVRSNSEYVPVNKCDLRSSAMLRSVYWQVVTDVSE